MLHKALLTVKSDSIDRTKFWVVELQVGSDFVGGAKTQFAFPKETPESFRSLYPEVDLDTYWRPRDENKVFVDWRYSSDGSWFNPRSNVTRDYLLYPKVVEALPSHGSVSIDLVFGRKNSSQYDRKYGYDYYIPGSSVKTSDSRLTVNTFTHSFSSSGGGTITSQLNIYLDCSNWYVRSKTIFTLSPLVSTNSADLNSKISSISWEENRTNYGVGSFSFIEHANPSSMKDPYITSGTHYTLSWKPA